MSDENTGFMGWLAGVSDTVLDVGGDVAVLWAENEFKDLTPVEKTAAAPGEATAAAGVVPAGVPAGDNVYVFGFPLNRTALYVAGGALAAAFVLKAIK